MVLVLWYGSLFLSIWCVIIAFHLSIMFSAFDVNADRAGRILDMLRQAERNEPNRKCLWTLQVPISLFSWGAISYIIGLAVLILRPLWEEGGWGVGDWVRFGFSLFVLAFCGYKLFQASSFNSWQPSLLSSQPSLLGSIEALESPSDL